MEEEEWRERAELTRVRADVCGVLTGLRAVFHRPTTGILITTTATPSPSAPTPPATPYGVLVFTKGTPAGRIERYSTPTTPDTALDF